MDVAAAGGGWLEVGSAMDLGCRHMIWSSEVVNQQKQIMVDFGLVLYF